MRSSLKLSVCIITYNHVRFIKDAIESVLNQKLPDSVEIIIADDFSSDGTREIIQEYSSKYSFIVPILQPHNVGPVINFKQLIESARGEYVVYLDGDDLMLPGKILFQMNYLDKNQDCAFIAHNMEVLNTTTGKTEGVFSKIRSGKYDLGMLVRYGTFFANSSKMYHKSSNDNYPFYSHYKFVGDYIWHIFHAQNKPFGYCSTCFGIYRRHNSGASASNRSVKRLKACHEENMKAIEYSAAYVGSSRHVKAGKLRETYAYALSCYNNGDFDEFKEYIRRSMNFGTYYSARHIFMCVLAIFPNFILTGFRK